MNKTDLLKSHIAAYTKKDGTLVSAHDTKVVKLSHTNLPGDFSGGSSNNKQLIGMAAEAKAAALAGDVRAINKIAKKAIGLRARGLAGYCSELVSRMEGNAPRTVPEWAKQSIVPLPSDFGTLHPYKQQKYKDVIDSMEYNDPSVIDGLAAKYSRDLNLNSVRRYAEAVATEMRKRGIKP